MKLWMRMATVVSISRPKSSGECQLKANGWKAIERDGLTGLYAVYATQVAIYQTYLDTIIPPSSAW